MAGDNSVSRDRVLSNGEDVGREASNEFGIRSYNSPETIDAVHGPLRLRDQEIRLVILEPASFVDAMPVCRLKVVKLATRPRL